MKMQIYLAVVVVIGMTGCSSKEKKVKLEKEKMLGNWIVTGISKTDKNVSEFTSISSSAITKENEILNVYQFNADNSFVSDTGSAAIRKGNFSLADTLISFQFTDSGTGTRQYAATQITDSSMYLLTDFPDDSKSKLAYKFVKLKKDASYDVAAVNWKTPLPKDAADAAIKDKLVAILQHYENYYTVLLSSGSKVFNQAKLLLPLKLYAGAVGTKSITETAEGFATIMGSKENAEKAFQKMSKAFSAPFEYPKSDNFMVGYIAVFHHLAQNIR